MKRTFTVVLAVVVLLSTVGMTGVGSAQEDKFPGYCYDPSGANWEEGTHISEGEITGTSNTPEDDDPIHVEIPQGQYLNFTVQLEDEKAGEMAMSPEVNPDGEFEVRGVEGGNGESTLRIPGDGTASGPTVNFEIWAQTDTEMCINIQQAYPSDWVAPHDWKVEIERSNPDVTLFDVRQLEDELTDAQSEITDLESQVEEKNDRINELESQLEGKNQTISELESQLEERNQTISELESQLENADVTIDVSVEPAGQASFLAGGEMAVDIDAQGTSASDVTLGFAGEEYTPTGGDATIPLEEAGTQQLTVEYEDTTETVTLNVESENDDSDTGDDDSTGASGDDDSTGDDTGGDDSTESDPDDGTTGGDGGSGDGFGPGFGPGAVLAGLGGAGYLLKRRGTDETDSS